MESFFGTMTTHEAYGNIHGSMMPKEGILLTSFFKISLDAKGIGYGVALQHLL